MPDETVIELLEKLRKAMLAKDTATMQRLINAYGEIYRELQSRLGALGEVVAAQAELTAGQFTRLQIYKDLMKEVEQELTKYQNFVELEINRAARDAIKQGVLDAKTLAGAKAAQVTAGWVNLNPRAIEAMLAFLQKDGALYGRLKLLAPTTVDAVSQAMINAVAIGDNPRTIARALVSAFKNELGGSLTDVMRMTRTSQIWAYREANRASYIANNDVVRGWVWFAELEGACLSCAAMHGTEHSLDETLDDHYNGRCYPKDTLVSGNSIEAFIARDYNGDLLTFATARGEKFSVTPNHPILTDRGWVEAKFIKSGDNVINYSGNQWTSSSINPNKDHGISRIQDIPSSLGMNWFRGVPTAAKNFNRQISDGNIDIIKANGFLRDGVYSFLPQPITKQYFGRGLFTSNFAGISPQSLFTFANNSSPASLLRHEYHIPLLFRAIFRNKQSVCFGRPANINSDFSKSSDDYRAGNPQDFCKFVLRHPGIIFLDKIINIDVIRFHGKVFNLQTKDRWYIASNIITHNCAMLPLTILDKENPVESGKDWFDNLPEDQQQKIMGDTKWQAYQDGKFSFEDLSKEHSDDVYGTMRGQATNKELFGDEE